MKKKIFATILVLAMIIGTIPLITLPVSADAPAIKVPVQTYALSPLNDTPTFTTQGGGQTGTIYGTDLCTIQSICSDGVYCTVQYPVTGGTRTQYAKLSSFFTTTSFTVGSITTSATVYRRSSGNDTLGSVDTRDTQVWVFGSQFESKTLRFF